MSRSSLVAALSVAVLAATVVAVPSLAQSPAASPGPSPSAAPATSPVASPAPAAVQPVAGRASASCKAFESASAQTVAVDIAQGYAATVRLCSNPTTGFRWSDPVSADPTIATVSGWTFEAPSKPIPGAPGVEALTVNGLAVGHTQVTASYDQPWDGGTKGAWTVTIEVTVRPAVTVAIDCAAFDASNKATAAVTAPVGSTVVLTVCSNASTGYTWRKPVSSEPAIAVPGAFVDQQVPAPTGDNPPIVGAPGAQVLSIAADASGTAVVSAKYQRPWEKKQAKSAWTFQLTVTVE
ncbi:MAG: protease inhibitor I42 family protein [Chloroflexota bacterium]